MIDIFNKKRIKELEEELEEKLEREAKRSDNRISELTDKLEKLERILKYAKDETSFHIVQVPQYQIFEGVLLRFDLYLYINKQEYIIRLDELCDMRVDVDSAKLEVRDDIAIFTIDYHRRYINFDTRTGIFTIDYRKNVYVFQHIEKESPNAGDGKELYYGRKAETDAD